MTREHPEVETYFVPDTSSAELNPGGANNNNWRSNGGNYQVNEIMTMTAPMRKYPQTRAAPSRPSPR